MTIATLNRETDLKHLAHIHIFKTNIGSENLRLLQGILSTHSKIDNWSVDTDDCDCVLRVISHTLYEHEIIQLIQGQGFECTDLD